MVRPTLDDDAVTKYERARIIGARALQISMGAPLLIDLTADDLKSMKYNTVNIAKKEFDSGVLPMKVLRKKPTVNETD